LQDGLQECESFDVFGVSSIPDAISMPTTFQLAERQMNFNIDSKALVKTHLPTPNTSGMTAKQTVEANIARIGFAQTLAQLQARNSVNSSTILNPQVPSVAVKEGDTLSGIVKNQMQALGKPVSHHQAARLAQDIARHNGLADPDRIYPGQRLNVAALSSPPLASGPDRGRRASRPNAECVVGVAPNTAAIQPTPPGVAKNLGPCCRQRFHPHARPSKSVRQNFDHVAYLPVCTR